MPKQVLQVTDFSAGLNAYSDAKDIQDNQFAQNWNAIVDKAGVIRAAGMGQDHIATEYHTSENFQKGYGLFQFSVDYSISQIDGSFSSGIKTGTVSAPASTSVATCQLEASYTGSTNEFAGMCVLIYAGAGVGQTRYINSNTATVDSTPPILTCSENWDIALTTASKYIIFRWKADANWRGIVGASTVAAKKDFITNGTSTFYEALTSINENSYYIFTAGTAADNESINLGYIQYPANTHANTTQLTLKPGIEYYLTFDCAAGQRWTNSISNGVEAGSGTSYGDKVPWVELYSSSVTDASGCVTTVDDLTPTTGEGNLSGTWEANKTYQGITQDSTTLGDPGGTGFSPNIKTDGSGNPTFFINESKGQGYIVDEEITFTDPGSTSNTATLKVASVNRTGLSLYENKWVSASDQDGYISLGKHNFVDNGDFAAGATSEWTTSGHATGITTSILDADGYNGQHGTLKMVSDNTFTHSSNIPSGYIENTTDYSLDDLTPYHLNFLYDSDTGMQYAIYDKTNDSYIKFWTRLHATRSSTENVSYKFPVETNSLIGGVNTNNTNYIKFNVGKNKAATTVESVYDKTAIEIRFAPIHPNSEFRLHGVTIYKAHNDLVTMSNNQNNSNPFKEDIRSFTKYYMSFKVPSSYNEVDTWYLKLHAGDYGFIASNTLGSTDTQKVYFDNIRLSSQEGDNVTLLSNNNSRYSDISLYSSKTGTWLTNFINWQGINAKPVYTYINGMLKISDANFESGNKNKLLFYQDTSIFNTHIHDGWVSKDSVIASPTSLSVSESASDNQSNFNYNAIPYLNAYYSNLYFGKTDESAYYDGENGEPVAVASPADHTRPGGWPLDAFGIYDSGSTASLTQSGTGGNMKGKYNGLVIRHFTQRASGDEDITKVIGGGWPNDDQKSTYTQSGGHWDKTRKYLYDTTLPWFSQNIDDGSGSGTGSGPYALVQSDEVTLSNRGWSDIKFEGDFTDSTKWNSSNPSNLKSNVHVEGYKTNIHQNPRWPVQFVIQGDNTTEYEIDGLGTISASPNQVCPSQLNSISKIKLKMEYTQSYRRWYNEAHWLPPVILLHVGILHPNDDGETNIKNKLQNGEELSYKPGTIISKKIAYAPDALFMDPGVNFGGGFAMNYNQADLIDENGYVKSIETQFGIAAIGRPWLYQLNIEIDLGIPINEIKKSDNILISLFESYTDQNHTDADPAFGEAGWVGHKHTNDTGQSGMWNHNRSFASSYDFRRQGYIYEYSLYTQNNETIIPCLFSRFRIKNIDLNFYNDNSEENAEQLIGSGTESQVNFVFGVPESVDSTGWGGRIFKVATTSVNIFDEESHIQESNSQIGFIDGVQSIQIGECPTVIVQIGDSQLKNPYVKKTKFYMRDTESDIYYLQFYVNHENNRLYSTTSSETSEGVYSTANGFTTWNLSRENFKNFNEVNSYESETMVSQKDAVSESTLIAQYKTAVVANSRLYVGNIKQNGKIYGDRMIKSPIGKYNILPASNFIDVAINDGDEITALAYYQDKLLQFKKRKVFIINTSGDYEFLEDTLNNVGVNQQCQVVTTPHGIMWANRRGCHLYDGKSMTNLIDGKIPETSDYTTIANNYWYASNTSLDGIPVIGYVDNRDTVIVKWEADDMDSLSGGICDGVSYHFPTKSWSFLNKAFSGDNAQTSSGAISNMMTSTDGDLLYYRFKSGDDGGASSTQANNLIKKWTNAGYDNGNLKVFTFTTKDFTFGDVSVRKKIYKVYITYKTNSNSKAKIYTSTNSVNSFSLTFNDTKSRFQGTSTACYDATTNGLLSTSGAWKTAEMFFTTPSDFNNIYSLQLRISSGGIPADFEINDISIVYRTKSLK